MATNERFDELLDLLLSATRTNAVQWQPTADEDAFRLTSATANIRISKFEEMDENSIEPISCWTIDLINDKGRLIEEVSPRALDQIQKFKDLHELARRSAYKTDDVLGTLIGELRNKTRLTSTKN